jgi:hypothetical protein
MQQLGPDAIKAMTTTAKAHADNTTKEKIANGKQAAGQQDAGGQPASS